MIPSPPPGIAGQRLLPCLVDEIADTDPYRVLYSIMKTKDPAEGFLDITAQDFARAVDKCAWHLRDLLGQAENFPTLTYLGPQDLVYAVLVLASVKTGYKLLLTSPRNSLDAHLALFDKTESNVLLMPPQFPLPIVKQILGARQMQVIEIPGLQHWMQHGPYKRFPYHKTFSEARYDPFVVLHTSGSTGIPKPIIQTHGTIAPLDAFTTLPSQGLPDTFPAVCAGKRVHLAFPLFHAAGICMLLPASLYGRFTIVLGTFPPSPELINSIHVHGNVQHSTLTPISMIELAKEPEYLENIGRLEQINYGGGPCPVEVGNLIAKKTRLLSCLGSTECGIMPIEIHDQTDWSYMSFSPALGCEYRSVSDDLYEQVIVRRPELDLYQGIFCTFRDIEEWPMKDLYAKHPTIDNQWLYKGRMDDIIVFSNGEKLNPIDMENIIVANHAVNSALIAGTGQPQSSLLVEVAENFLGLEERELLDIIWPSVEAANEMSPSYGRIYRHMIAFTSIDKPMLRAGKGTVQRSLTLELYKPELDALYKSANELTSVCLKAIPEGSKNLGELKDIISKSLDIDISQLASDADLFEYGIDSLKIMVLTRNINNLLNATGKTRLLETKTIYANRTVSQLIDAVTALVNGEKRSIEVEEPTVEKVYAEFAAEIPISARLPERIDSKHLVVILTGSTGSLGSYILNSLVQDEKVSRIYCLNRGPRSEQRQQKALEEREILLEKRDKVQFLDADMSKPRFGLSKQEYSRLLVEVTHVIHNAWQVNFNLNLGSFISQINGVKRLIEFSTNSRFGAQLSFISSISTVTAAGQDVGEQLYRNKDLFEDTGYAKSKYISELLLDDAARDAGIPVVVCRVGQIAGPTTVAGVWPKNEWLPSLITSSQYLGKIPASLGRTNIVDWVPVDILGQSIVELATHAPETGEAGATVFNVVNPHQISWSDLLPVVQQTLRTVEVVSLPEWTTALQQSVSDTQDVSANPAIKMLEFYTNLNSLPPGKLGLETKHTTAISKTLANLGPVKAEWMANWLSQWGMY